MPDPFISVPLASLRSSFSFLSLFPIQKASWRNLSVFVSLFLKYTFQGMINSGWCQLVTEQAMQKHVAPLFASVESLLLPQRQHLLLERLYLYKTKLHSGCLSSKNSFAARASSVAAFCSHWYFSIQGWPSPEVRNKVVPKICDAVCPMYLLHVLITPRPEVR